MLRTEEEKVFKKFCKENGFKSVQDFTGPGVSELREIYTQNDNINSELLLLKSEISSLNIAQIV